ncbi:recombinase family protein [Anaerocolumna sp. MB42-C2]|uniref:recombinase family protein n=1 Tax=Anaerocolumna sp. MB42-C2 TaxID=3070997 RepID=UPI0027E1EC7E|nr:recombinase family protein [Anaerocolumna sp. MB42-C2]WMJ87328.1 recombinase family protein [Anaerocolumna sp. MB42-C2]
MQSAALYIRVSTEDQAEFSPDAQKRLLLDYAKRNHILVDEEYIFIDEGISGRIAEKRPGFMSMIAIAKKKPKPFDIILVHRFDRFSRSREDSIVYKSLLKKECNIRVVSITEQLEDDKFSVILEAMLEAMAEYYSLNLADEVMKGMTEKALRGGYQANPPLGYRIFHKGELPVIVPAEARIIKLIFHKYVYDNMSSFQIAKLLNSLGYKTKQKKDFERRSIEYILKNPMYKGFIRWNQIHNATKSLKEKSEWVIVKGQHEPIISEELFEKAQEINRKESTKCKKSRPVTEYKHWLTGLLKCSNCGRSMTVTKGKNTRFSQFCCSGYTKGKCPVCNSISENILIPVIVQTLSKVLYSVKGDYILNESQPVMGTMILDQQLNKLKEKENRIKNSYLNGIDTMDEYRKNKELLQKERFYILKQLEVITVNNMDNTNDIRNHLDSVYKIIISDQFDNLMKNRALRSIIDKIEYNKKDGCLNFYFI